MLGLGGALGTVMRRLIGLLTLRVLGDALPFATLTANVLGSFLLGALFYLASSRTIAGVDARLVLGTGVMGGFTTYSSFNLETLLLLQEGAYARAATYVALTLCTCLAAGAVGLAVGRALFTT